jgi:hypothetical protein
MEVTVKKLTVLVKERINTGLPKINIDDEQF